MELSLDTQDFSNEIDNIFSSIKTRLIDMAYAGIDLFEVETKTQKLVNEVGKKMMEQVLNQYDLNADAIKYNRNRYNKAGRYKKAYQTVFGEIEVERAIYRNFTSETERSICPLEIRAGIIGGFWTPKAAKVGALIMTEVPSKTSAKIINSALQIDTCSSSLDRLMKSVGATWEENRQKFDLKIIKQIKIPKEATSLAVSLDGVLIPTRCTRVLPSDSRYEEASCGTVSFLDEEGNQLSTLYFSRSPEHKKVTLKSQIKQAFDYIMTKKPNLTVVKIADGSRDNWTFLESEIEGDWQLIDFYHAAEHLKEGLDAYFGEESLESRKQFSFYRQKLRHNKTGADQVLKYLKELSSKKPRSKKLAEQVTYFSRNRPKMKYAQAKAAGLSIGSGIVEAACKTVVSERLKRSGMQWDYEGAQSVLSLRAISRSQKLDAGFDMIRDGNKKKVTPLKKIKRNQYEPMVENIAA